MKETIWTNWWKMANEKLHTYKHIESIAENDHKDGDISSTNFMIFETGSYQNHKNVVLRRETELSPRLHQNYVIEFCRSKLNIVFHLKKGGGNYSV